MARKKLIHKSSRTKRTIFLILVVLLLWIAYSDNVLESILSGQIFTLRLVSRFLEGACKYEANIPLGYDISPLQNQQRKSLTTNEIERIRKCNRTATKQSTFGEVKAKLYKQVRWTSHTYLDSKSTVVELGGYHGDDVEQIFSRYRPRRYIVVEPVPEFYKKLVLRFQNESNILVLNFGIGFEDGEAKVNLSNDGTTSFEMKFGSVPLRIVSAKHFFIGLGVGFFDIDLLTMNCEGCEYAVLDFLISTNTIQHIRNIQFQPHKLGKGGNSVYKYCEYQEHLKKTHKIMFRHQFWWESWTIKESYISQGVKDVDNDKHKFDDIIHNSTLMDAILD